jgi:serine protease Do
MAMAGMLRAEPAPKADDARTVYGFDFREVIKEATDRVFPAVVFIKCVRESHESGKKSSQEVSGSGVLIAPDGRLVTNWHVVDKAVEVRCLLRNGEACEAKVVGTDKDTDLALLKLQRAADAPPVPSAELGDSSRLTEGDFVMAMGAPWGLSRSVSIGIISCTQRFLPDSGEYSLWLQTDASISPGNSGGPLVNSEGEVVGINSLGSMIGGDLGFAIPSNTVRIVAQQLEEFGRMNWSWTGLQLQPLKDFKRNMYFEGSEGVIVAETDPESPARKAGIQPRDRILSINDQPVDAITEEDLPDIRRMLGLLPKYQSARFTLQREAKRLEIALTPREKGDVEGKEQDCPRWGFTVKTINQFDNPDLYFHRKKGLFVYGIRYPGNASDAGLRRSDILLKIENKPVETLEEIAAAHQAALDNITKSHRAILTVLRNGLMHQIVLDYGRDYENE